MSVQLAATAVPDRLAADGDAAASARKPRLRAKGLVGYLYVFPALALLAVFAYWPFVGAFKLALYRSDGLGVNDFVGLQNFRALLTDPQFAHAFRVLGLFALGLPLGIFGPFLGAKLIHSLANTRAAYAYRVLFVLPVVVPAMTVILVWRDLYGPDGAVNRLLRLVGLDEYAGTWLGNADTVIPAMILMGLPWVGGISMLLFLAGFIRIPKSQYEAAYLDGASAADILFRIEMPLLMPQFRIVTILALLGLIQSYDNVLVLTNGGPGDATMVPGLYLFKNGFEYGQLGYASAIGFVLFLLCLALTMLNTRLMRRRGW